MGSATAGQVKDALLGVAYAQQSLLEFFSAFNDEFAKRIGLDRARGTWEQYRYAYNCVSEFIQRKYGLTDIAFCALDYSFIEKFDFYLRVEKQFMPGSIIEITRHLCYIVRKAKSKRIISHNPFAGYKPPRAERKQKYLSEADLSKIMSTPLNNNRLYDIRDMFLFACFTGLSFIDVRNLTEANLETAHDGLVWIKTKRQKTGVECNVPLMDITEALLEKYKGHRLSGRLLPMPGNTSINQYLKVLAKTCGIEKPMTYHITRHNFGTHITLSQGVPIATVSKMMGHTSITTTQIYAHTTGQEVDEDMRLHRARISGKYTLYEPAAQVEN